MENASKALIIAGSILVSIMVIALGVTIFNKAQDAADTSTLDTTEITMFNSKFERYLDNQSGSQVKSLISFAISNASTNKDEPAKLPTITLGGTTANGGAQASGANIQAYIDVLTSIRSSVISTRPYNVQPGYNSDSLITSITIN